MNNLTNPCRHVLPRHHSSCVCRRRPRLRHGRRQVTVIAPPYFVGMRLTHRLTRLTLFPLTQLKQASKHVNKHASASLDAPESPKPPNQMRNDYPTKTMCGHGPLVAGGAKLANYDLRLRRKLRSRECSPRCKYSPAQQKLKGHFAARFSRPFLVLDLFGLGSRLFYAAPASYPPAASHGHRSIHRSIYMQNLDK